MSGVFQWSQTAASNASADPTINWAEGQAPSSVNDSARALMSSVAKFRDDTSGMLLTTGSSAAYIVASNQGFDTLANFHNKTIFFTPHVTNAIGPVTVSVDGFANLPLRTSPGKELSAGILIQGTPYGAIYNNTDGSLYLQGYYPAPTTFNIPLAGGMDFWGTTVPNSSFAFPIGQAISRTTYATLFAIMGTTYGTGDGSTTFNIPDKTGRVSAMQEASASRLTVTYFGGNSAALGAVGGGESQTLTLAQLPTGITSTGSGTVSVGSTSGRANIPVTDGTLVPVADGGGTHSVPGQNGGSWGFVTALTGNTSTITSTSNNTGGAAHRTVQPTIVCNYIIRII